MPRCKTAPSSVFVHGELERGKRRIPLLPLKWRSFLRYKAMKKLILLVLCCLLVFVPAVAAQDGELLWELDAEFTVSDLQFTFNLPGTWFFDDSNGIAFAETEEDLAALVDDDEETQPEGYTMRLAVVSMAAITVEEGATLEEIAEVVISSAGIEIQETFELPVMVYRSIAIAGVNEDGRAGIANLWMQDDNLVIFSFGTPETELSGDAAYTWGNIVGSVTSLLPEGFEVEEFAVEEHGFGLLAPVDWEAQVTDTDISFMSEDAMIAVNVEELTALGLEEDATLEDVRGFIDDFLSQLEDGAEIVDEGEFVVFEQPGFGFSMTDPESGGVEFIIITLGSNGYAVSYNLSAPDEESYAMLKPVFILMLQSMTPLETE